MGPAIRGESGRREVRDDVDVDFVAMLLRGETRVHDGDWASGAEATPAAGPWADYRLRLTLDQWTPDGAVSGEITDITRLRLRFRSDYGTVTALARQVCVSSMLCVFLAPPSAVFPYSRNHDRTHYI